MCAIASAYGDDCLFVIYVGLRVAAEGAVRENIFDNEEPGGGVGRLARRRAAARGTRGRLRTEVPPPNAAFLIIL